MKLSILIDKSWLDGTKQQIIQKLADNYKVVIPDCLFFEIMTDEKKEPKVLLKKLLSIRVDYNKIPCGGRS